MEAETVKVFKQMGEVGRSIKAVKMVKMKLFKARHIYDIYNMMQPILAEHGLLISRSLLKDSEKDVTSKNGTKGTHRYQVWKFIFTAEDGSIFETEFPGESIDWGCKAASQCDSMSFKQMLIHTFQIPTEIDDPDDGDRSNPVKSESPEDAGKKKQPRPHIVKLWDLAKSKNLNKNKVEKSLYTRYKFVDPNKLNKEQYYEFMGVMKAMVQRPTNHAPGADNK